jgi:hypothetical protein
MSCNKKNQNQTQGHAFQIFPVIFKIEYMIFIYIYIFNISVFAVLRT